MASTGPSAHLAPSSQLDVLDSRSEAVMAVKLAGLIGEEFCCKGRHDGRAPSGTGAIGLCGYQRTIPPTLPEERRLTHYRNYLL